MPVSLVTADQRASSAYDTTSLAIFGPAGVGKTTLASTLPGERSLVIDLEAGMKPLRHWSGVSLPVRAYTDFRDLAILIGGADPAKPDTEAYSAGHHAHIVQTYRDAGLNDVLAALAERSIIFVDSITDLTRQAMVWAKQQPEAFSARTGQPDVRGAYGLLGREVITALKHLQHARGRTVIFVGVLEKVTDDYGTVHWQPQTEGSKVMRELPGIVDQVISMHHFRPDTDGTGWVLDEQADGRRLVCRAGNRYGLPAKDRSGQLDETEAPDLGALLTRINQDGPSPSSTTSWSA
ncbi:ATP-binding protein [Roseospira visakhapatnamensis]|uniref:AAA+ ATPase domain-containing protein n=1 Tax=Roseospira visakhapatnamensis TaxID=390880 RepID=A0A7W6WBM9_9PROT|nr:ATP-binding protein [Roseospira visakhapatnamensis]MBB4267707.1 hypothetical protein [Roseospira visakhapatnamensis]